MTVNMNMKMTVKVNMKMAVSEHECDQNIENRRSSHPSTRTIASVCRILPVVFCVSVSVVFDAGTITF